MTFRAASIVVLVAVACLSGCRDAPPVPPKATVATAPADPRGDGDAAAQRKDWAAAATHYALAVQQTPNDLKLRFAYGSVLSHLDRAADAAEQFAWVVQHGAAGSAEVLAARQWLQQSGVAARARGEATQVPVMRPTVARIEV